MLVPTGSQMFGTYLIGTGMVWCQIFNGLGSSLVEHGKYHQHGENEHLEVYISYKIGQ